VSGKKKQNTIKATVASDAHGRPMWAGAIRPGRQHDQTAARTEGLDDLLDAYPEVKFLVDAGYRGLAKDHPEQVIAPPLKPKKDAPPDEIAAYETTRKAQSSQRIPPNTPSPRSNGGAPCNASPAAATSYQRPSAPLRAWPATAPQPDEPTPTPNSIDPRSLRIC
jgi:DDE superfamily endonuclease